MTYDITGKACFNCEQENDGQLGLDTSLCTRCYPQVNSGTGAHLISHNSAHILFDSGLQKSTLMPCGFCLRSSAACLIYLVGTTDIQVDYKMSVCPKLCKFAYKP